MTGKQQLLFAVLCLGLVVTSVALPSQNRHKEQHDANHHKLQHQQRHARVAGHRAHRALEADNVNAENTIFISNGGNAWAVKVVGDIKSSKGKTILSGTSNAVLKAFASADDRDTSHKALAPLKRANFDFVASLYDDNLKIDGPCVHVPTSFRAMRGKTCYYMVMQNGGATDMQRCVESFDKMTKDVFKKFLERLMDNMSTFHSRGWYHRDLQLKNIMVSTCLKSYSLIKFIDNDLVEHIPEDNPTTANLAKFGYMFRDIQTIFGLGYSGASPLPDLFKTAPLAVKNAMLTSINKLQTDVSEAYETAFKEELQKLIDAASGAEKEGLEKLNEDVWTASLGEPLARGATYAQLLKMVGKVEKAVADVVSAW